MWINEVAPERLAELFHHYHQALIVGNFRQGQRKARLVERSSATGEEPPGRCGASGLAGTGVNGQRQSKDATVFRTAGRGGVGLLAKDICKWLWKGEPIPRPL